MMVDVDRFCCWNVEGRVGRTGAAQECRLSSFMHLFLFNEVIVFYWRTQRGEGGETEYSG